jgi:hypothetical protein
MQEQSYGSCGDRRSVSRVAVEGHLFLWETHFELCKNLCLLIECDVVRTICSIQRGVPGDERFESAEQGQPPRALDPSRYKGLLVTFLEVLETWYSRMNLNFVALDENSFHLTLKKL